MMIKDEDLGYSSPPRTCAVDRSIRV